MNRFLSSSSLLLLFESTESQLILFHSTEIRPLSYHQFRSEHFDGAIKELFALFPLFGYLIRKKKRNDKMIWGILQIKRHLGHV